MNSNDKAAVVALGMYLTFILGIFLCDTAFRIWGH